MTDAFASDFPEISGVADMCISELRSLSEECTVMADRAMRQLAFAMIPTTWLLLDFGPADFVVSSDEAEAELVGRATATPSPRWPTPLPFAVRRSTASRSGCCARCTAAC